MKLSWISILKFNRFNFGGRIVYQFVLFECKFLFSIIFFYFTKSDIVQDRFHTHAFNALSVKLFGSYNEYILVDEKTGEYEMIERTETFKWFPRESYHAIGESKSGCATILFSGYWKSTWKEWINGEVKNYSWHRKSI
jgi:hypothetical protein